MKILKTPAERFENLPNYPFEANFLSLDNGLQIHYLKEGINETEIVLMLHGEPSWSYLYRKMIPIVAEAGYQVIAPDLIGFGKSDKLVDKSDYSYQNYVDWMTEFVKKLDLKNITLVCQDWGGLIGLRIAAENEECFKRITTSNTFLPTGQGKPSEAFLQWQKFSQESPKFNVVKVINSGSVSTLSEEEIAAYNAPFPDESYMVAARIFPSLVPTSEDDPAIPANLKAWQVFQKWEKPFLTTFGDSDPITKGGDMYFQKIIPGTKGQKHTTLEKGGHFIQEDKGEEWAKIIVQFIQDNP